MRRRRGVRHRGNAAPALAALAALAWSCGGGETSLAGDPDGDTPHPCFTDQQCRDDNPCNGDERCGPDGACRDGDRPPDGTTCDPGSGPGFCRAGTCMPGTCGNGRLDPGEECDDGNDLPGDGCDMWCRDGCRIGDDCDDGNPCTADDCIPAGTGARCERSPVPDGTTCNDGDFCTAADGCSAGTCVGASLDPECDDGDPCTHDGCVPEPTGPAGWGCDSERFPDWYPDADGDGWGAEGATVCAASAPPGYGSPGDCCDADDDVFPDQPRTFAAPYRCTPGGGESWDYDCDGTVTRWRPDEATECPRGYMDAGDCPDADGWCAASADEPGCVGVPACGEVALFQESCTRSWDCGASVRRGDDDPEDGDPVDAGAAAPEESDGGSDRVSAKESIDHYDVRDDGPGYYCCSAQLVERAQGCR